MAVYTELQIKIVGIVESPHGIFIRFSDSVKPPEMLEKVREFDERLNDTTGIDAFLNIIDETQENIASEDEKFGYEYELKYEEESAYPTFLVTGDVEKDHSYPLDRWTTDYAENIELNETEE